MEINTLASELRDRPDENTADFQGYETTLKFWLSFKDRKILMHFTIIVLLLLLKKQKQKKKTL